MRKVESDNVVVLYAVFLPLRANTRLKQANNRTNLADFSSGSPFKNPANSNP
jgi:hypothetical protein